jgi:RimJ/RimL family protein N-acetyltransferase
VPSFATITTERLQLTAVDEHDLADFHALHSDPDLFRHAPEAMHPDLDHSRSVLECLAADWASVGLGYWSIHDGSTGNYLGTGGVRRGSYRGQPADTWNIYYRLAIQAWGHGYAAEVIRAAAPCAETIQPGALLQAMMRPWNSASVGVAKQLGMTFCGSQLDHGGIEELVYQLPAADVR